VSDLGQPLTATVDATIVVLAADAAQGRLAVCAGAGISIPLGLPSGSDLGRLLHERFRQVTGYACTVPDDLLAVADAAAQLPDGLAAVQHTVLDVAPFDEARPALAHHLLALLVAEGAIRLLLTNWDNCVERARRAYEHIPTARTESEAEGLRGQFVVKLHGCCTWADTLLITSAQLSDPPLWAKAYFEAELARSSMVFVGIGNVADYAQRRISELVALVGANRVRIVSPNIATDWDRSQWSALLPALPTSRRVEKPADTFLDELARRWVMVLIDELHAIQRANALCAADIVAAAFCTFTALQALKWLRGATSGWPIGRSVVRAPAALSTLEAIGLLAREAAGAGEPMVRFVPASAVQIHERIVHVVIVPDRRTSTDISRVVTERAQEIVHRTGLLEELSFLIAADSVRGPKPARLPAADLVDPYAPIDQLVGAATQVSIAITYVDDVLRAA